MPDWAGTATANSSGAATVPVGPIPTGKEWVLQQMGIYTNPAAASGCSATLFRNGQVVSATSQGSAGSAGGYPFYRVTSADHFTCTWAGAPVGAQCILTASYSEHPIGQATNANTGIV
jgi:hypothetical protein